MCNLEVDELMKKNKNESSEKSSQDFEAEHSN